jgi:hypothetical protein
MPDVTIVEPYLSRILVALGLAVAVTACGSATDHGGAGSADVGASNEIDAFPASAATRKALGVVQWTFTSSETDGLDADQHVALSYQYTFTNISDQQGVLQLVLREHGRTSRHSVTLENLGNGTALVSKVQVESADPEAAARAVSFLQDDVNAAIANSTVRHLTTGINISNLHANWVPLVQPPDGPLSAACVPNAAGVLVWTEAWYRVGSGAYIKEYEQCPGPMPP